MLLSGDYTLPNTIVRHLLLCSKLPLTALNPMTKQLTTSLLAGGLGLLTVSAQAQVRFSVGPQVGLNAATIHFTDPQTFPSSFRTGFAAGLLGNVCWGHFALQPAVLFSQKGYHLEGTYISTGSQSPFSFNGKGDYRLNYLTIPLNVLYAQRATGQGVQVFAGPYLSWLVGGHYEAQTTYVNSSLSIAREGKVVAGDVYQITDDNAYSQRLDSGLQAGLGYRYKAAVLQASYSLGLRNLASDVKLGANSPASPTAAYYNRAFQVSLAYLFGS